MVVASQLLLLLGATVAEGMCPPRGVLIPSLLGLVFDPKGSGGASDDDQEEAW